jgi:hypothetical protein
MKQLQMFINGEWVKAQSGKTRDILNPANGEVIAQAAEGDVEDARHAILAARKTFDSGEWSELPAAQRANYLFAIAGKLEERADEIARLETEDNGKPLREAQFDVADAAACFRYYAGLVTKPDGQTYHVADPMQAMVVREPVGVCGLIVPWNYPLLMSVWKIAPALAAGNTIVFKPSEVTPVTGVTLFEMNLPRAIWWTKSLSQAEPPLVEELCKRPRAISRKFLWSWAENLRISSLPTLILKRQSITLSSPFMPIRGRYAQQVHDYCWRIKSTTVSWRGW